MLFQFFHFLIIGQYFLVVLFHIMVVLCKFCIIYCKFGLIFCFQLITILLLLDFRIDSRNLSSIICFDCRYICINLHLGLCYSIVDILIFLNRYTSIFCSLYSIIQFCSIDRYFNSFCGISRRHNCCIARKYR